MSAADALQLASVKANRIVCLAKAAKSMLKTSAVWDDGDDELHAVCECIDAVVENAMELRQRTAELAA